MQPNIELVIFFLTQTGLLVWIISGMRTEIKNHTYWLKQLAFQSNRNAQSLARIEGAQAVKNGQ